jgi:hypothetical protein
MTTTLSKSKYLAGYQCPNRLWLACFSPELAAEASDRVWDSDKVLTFERRWHDNG